MKGVLQEHEVSGFHPGGNAAKTGLHDVRQQPAATDGTPQHKRAQHGGAPAAGLPGGVYLRDPPPDPPPGDPQVWLLIAYPQFLANPKADAQAGAEQPQLDHNRLLCVATDQLSGGRFEDCEQVGSVCLPGRMLNWLSTALPVAGKL